MQANDEKSRHPACLGRVISYSAHSCLLGYLYLYFRTRAHLRLAHFVSHLSFYVYDAHISPRHLILIPHYAYLPRIFISPPPFSFSFSFLVSLSFPSILSAHTNQLKKRYLATCIRYVAWSFLTFSFLWLGFSSRSCKPHQISYYIVFLLTTTASLIILVLTRVVFLAR